MSEIRLYVTTAEKKAGQVLDLLTDVFGEEDFAIATTEIDEKKDIWEASVYMMADGRGRWFASASPEVSPKAPFPDSGDPARSHSGYRLDRQVA